MGVRKLWSFVSQVNSGTTRSFSYHPACENGVSDWPTSLIFDGPSFAYWFWKENTLREGTAATLPALFGPSLTDKDEYAKYATLITTFIKGLVELGKFKLYAIYAETILILRTFLFDGALPKWKWSERARRYQSLIKDYTAQAAGKSRYTAPPFVVLVCQQTLIKLSSEHGITVKVVPGEADEHCVWTSRTENNAIVLSSDGDFFVYMGEEGSFVPLQLFPLSAEQTLSLIVYTRVRENLGLSREGTMVELAALLGERVALTPAQCVRCINLRQTLDYISKDTLNRYLEIYTIAPFEDSNRKGGKYMDRGDIPGRLTELFFYEGVPIHWLPQFPITNPPRKSPWLISRPIRQSAYYQLREHGAIKGDCVTEIIRRAERMAEDTVPIEDVEINLRDTSAQSVFIYAMQLLLEFSSNEEMKLLPAFAEMFHSMGSKMTPVHIILPPAAHYLILQYQSIIYSLIIYLHSRSAAVNSIPQFSTLWDLTRFKLALTSNPSMKEKAWMGILDQMDSDLRDLWNVNSLQSKSQKKKAKLKRLNEEKAPGYIDQNRFSVLLSSAADSSGELG